jgi:hypothetical protein
MKINSKLKIWYILLFHIIEKSSTVLETQYIAPLRFKPITVNDYEYSKVGNVSPEHRNG